VGPRLEHALRQVWAGEVEDDALNRLILVTDLTARQIVVLRTYAKFLRQSGSSFSNAYVADTLAMYPDIAARLVRLFETLFDPTARGDREAAGEAVRGEIVAALETVSNLDRDRILRAFLLLIRKTLRTNFFQRDEAGQPKAIYQSSSPARRSICCRCRGRCSRSSSIRPAWRDATCAAARWRGAACAGPTAWRTSAPRSSG